MTEPDIIKLTSLQKKILVALYEAQMHKGRVGVTTKQIAEKIGEPIQDVRVAMSVLVSIGYIAQSNEPVS